MKIHRDHAHCASRRSFLYTSASVALSEFKALGRNTPSPMTGCLDESCS